MELGRVDTRMSATEWSAAGESRMDSSAEIHPKEGMVSIGGTQRVTNIGRVETAEASSELEPLKRKTQSGPAIVTPGGPNAPKPSEPVDARRD
jgi:hypothetical protein